MNHEGPDLWLTVSVPAGINRVSIYLMNKDGHLGNDRFRDYLLQVLPYRKSPWESSELPPLAQSRVRMFWNGCYQSFAVCGPTKVYIVLHKNNSLNATLAGVLMDKLAGPPTPYEQIFTTLHSVYLITPLYASYIRPPSPITAAPDSAAAVAQATWSLLDDAVGNADWAPELAADRFLCYRFLSNNSPPASLKTQLGYWRRSLPYETDYDRSNFLTSMSAMFADEEKLCPNLASGNL